jgi:hypothetical protein
MDTETTQVRPPEYGEADGSRVYPFKRGSVVIDADDDRAVVEKHSLREKAWVLVRYITGPCKGRTMYQMERNLSDANAGALPRNEVE